MEVYDGGGFVRPHVGLGDWMPETDKDSRDDLPPATRAKQNVKPFKDSQHPRKLCKPCPQIVPQVPHANMVPMMMSPQANMVSMMSPHANMVSMMSPQMMSQTPPQEKNDMAFLIFSVALLLIGASLAIMTVIALACLVVKGTFVGITTASVP